MDTMKNLSEALCDYFQESHDKIISGKKLTKKETENIKNFVIGYATALQDNAVEVPAILRMNIICGRCDRFFNSSEARI